MEVASPHSCGFRCLADVRPEHRGRRLAVCGAQLHRGWNISLKPYKSLSTSLFSPGPTQDSEDVSAQAHTTASLCLLAVGVSQTLLGSRGGGQVPHHMHMHESTCVLISLIQPLGHRACSMRMHLPAPSPSQSSLHMAPCCPQAQMSSLLAGPHTALHTHSNLCPCPTVCAHVQACSVCRSPRSRHIPACSHVHWTLTQTQARTPSIWTHSHLTSSQCMSHLR